MQLIKNFIYNNGTLRHISQGGRVVFWEKVKKLPYRLFLTIVD